MSRFLILLITTAMLLSCKEDPEMMGDITGMVVDDDSGAPISGATISVTTADLTTTTSVTGRFTLENVPVGVPSIIASLEGYPDVKQVVRVLDGQTAEVELRMTRDLPKITPEEVTLIISDQSKAVEIENQGNNDYNLTFSSSQSWLKLDQTQMTLKASEKKDLIISVDFNDIDAGNYNEEVYATLNGYTMSIPVTINNVALPEIVWKNWYLSVPINNGSGKATSIYYEDIINDNLTVAEKEYFYYDETTGSYVFWTKFTGFTTSGTYPLDGDAYCRTELREFWQGNQSTDDNWFFNPGETHIMESTLNVDYVEGSRGRTFIAQIHGKKSILPGIDNGPATVKVLWEKGEIEVEYYVKPPDPDGEWTSAYNAKSQRYRVDNEIFTIKLKVVDGVLSWALTCDAKSIETDYVELFDYASNGYHYDNYFKTGNYFQWKSDYDKSSQVRLYKVITSHQ